jgi:hypothetical protein
LLRPRNRDSKAFVGQADPDAIIAATGSRMHQGYGARTRDDANRNAKRHDNAEQHERAQAGFVGNPGASEPPYGSGGKDAQHKSDQAPQIDSLWIVKGASGNPRRRRQEGQNQDEFEHTGAFDQLCEAQVKPR